MDEWDDKDWGLLIRGSAGYLNSQEDVRRVAELINRHRGAVAENIPPEMWMMGYCAALFNERLKGSNR